MAPKRFPLHRVRALLSTLFIALYQAILLPRARADDATKKPALSAPPLSHPAAARPDYHPSFRDLMTMAVQPRHIKLAVASRAANWACAYGVNELRNAFARIGTISLYNGADTQALFAATTRDSLDAVATAIKDHNAGEFHRAYARLTAACNPCHVSRRHAFAAIKVLTPSPYADQDLRASMR